MENVILREIGGCSLDQQKALRDIRNEESIRKAMYTDHVISLDEHLSWIKNLEGDDRQIVFVVTLNGVVAGMASINALDRRHKKSDWAFYLDASARGGLGAALEYRMINFAFEDLKLEKLNCEVLESNPAVVRLHKKFGFAEEGFRRSNVEKDGERIGVHFLGLTKQDWMAHRDEVHDGYRTAIEKFHITLEKPKFTK